MSDIDVKMFAKELGKSLEDLSPVIESQLTRAVESVAESTYRGIFNAVQNSKHDPKNRQAYLKGLKYERVGASSWVIHLEGDWATRLEDGWNSYSIKDVLLKSKKIVQVGERSGQPWVRESKKGNKYAAVPFFHKPFSGENTGDLATEIKKLQAKNKATGKMQPFSKVFKDLEGKPLSGKVASVDVPGQKNLAGLTKFQHVYESGRTSSVYMTWRMVSSKSKGFIHPGFKGYQLFRDAEEQLELELERVIRILGQ